MKTKNGLYVFDSIFELVQQLDIHFGLEYWMNNRIGDVYVSDILIYVDRGLRFDPTTDYQYEKVYHLFNMSSLKEFNPRLS